MATDEHGEPMDVEDIDPVILDEIQDGLPTGEEMPDHDEEDGGE